jgi:hypothetical protein
MVKGPRQADPAIHGATWTAWATGDGQRAGGHGGSAEHAMADLANQPAPHPPGSDRLATAS